MWSAHSHPRVLTCVHVCPLTHTLTCGCTHTTADSHPTGPHPPPAPGRQTGPALEPPGQAGELTPAAPDAEGPGAGPAGREAWATSGHTALTCYKASQLTPKWTRLGQRTQESSCPGPGVAGPWRPAAVAVPSAWLRRGFCPPLSFAFSFCLRVVHQAGARCPEPAVGPPGEVCPALAPAPPTWLPPHRGPRRKWETQADSSDHSNSGSGPGARPPRTQRPQAVSKARAPSVPERQPVALLPRTQCQRNHKSQPGPGGLASCPPRPRTSNAGPALMCGSFRGIGFPAGMRATPVRTRGRAGRPQSLPDRPAN